MIHIFIGTKAQLIKMAPIMAELQRRRIEYNFIVSGQHKDTMDDLRANFKIKEPDVVLYKGDDITSITKMLAWSMRLIIFALLNRNKVWRNDKSGIVLNHGDTFSTLIGSILARLSGHKSAHIESGLRSFNILHPFPEELTRLIVFRLSNYYFSPNQWAQDNLHKYSGVKVNTLANTLFDSLQTIKDQPVPSDLDIPDEDYCLVSLHRFENLYKDAKLEKLVDLLIQISQTIKPIFIMHKPTLKRLQDAGLYNRLCNNTKIEIRPRYDYLRFICLVNHAKFIITDGGSNQEECYYLGKPCLLFREATERQEGIGKNAVLSKFDDKIIQNFIANVEQFEGEPIRLSISPSERIVNEIAMYQ